MSELKKGFYLVTADGINTMLRWDGEDWVDMRGIRPCFKEVVQTRYCGENNPVFERDEPVLWSMPDGKIADKWALQFYRGVEGTPLYTHPQPRKPVKFPTMLRKMWSGGDVQAWLDENVNKE